MKSVIAMMVMLLAVSTAEAADRAKFSFSFTWKGLALCTTGNPNYVSNPEFIVKNLPAGTKSLVFRLTDLNVPGFNHGGGKVIISASGKIKRGAFKYWSPCPPNGRHLYEWKAVAKAKRNGTGATLGVARASRLYP